MKKKFIWLTILITIFLSACMLPEKEDPFSKIPEEKIETLTGEIFPFSVSVSTRATHRLEESNKLVALLASKIVRLEEFEGRKVEISGVFRKEKMRPIFWVESIKVKDLEKDSIKSTSRFENKDYSFIVPKTWESSTLEDETVHFIDKKDPNRKVFLIFKKQDISASDKKNDPNIVIANMAGNKVSSTFDSGQVRQEITLFSNLFENKKYVFVFNNNSEDFSRKKDFFKLLNSFIEGEENVQIAHEEELKKMAEAEVKLVQEDEKNKETEAAKEEYSEKEEGSIISRIFGSDDEKEKQTIDSIAKEEEHTEIILNNEFRNLIDDKAFYYESSYYKFSMKVPYGLWFKNFGQNEDYIAQIGFAEHEVDSRANSSFLLNIISSDLPINEFMETQDGENLVIKFPRNDKSYYELRGSIDYRDYMRSVQSTIESF